MSLLLDIFLAFFRISLLSFGGIFGVLPQMERIVVVEHGWLTHERFVQAYVLSQFLPGPNSAMCALIGYWVDGWAGFAAGFLGMYLVPVLLMGLACPLFGKYRSLEPVRKAEMALRPVVLGLVSASAARLWWLEAAGPGAMPGLFRALAVPITAAGIAAYWRGRLGPFQLILGAGAIWWALGTLLARG